MIFVSTQAVMLFLFFAASAAAFMVGRSLEFKNQDDIIENTIMFLVDKGMVNWERNEDGEIELFPIDDK
jgi:hypothetical protein